MARGLSTALKNELINQSVKPVLLIEILFPTPIRITTHYKDLTHNSNTYTSSPHLLDITNTSESSQINVSSFAIRLSAVDSTYSSIVLNNNVSNDEVTIDVAFLNSTDSIIDTFNFNKGFVESFGIDTKNGIIGLNCTSHFADFSRVAGRKTNEGSQQVYFSTDKGMEFASLTLKDLLWGKK